jgi:hypothetical protein
VEEDIHASCSKGDHYHEIKDQGVFEKFREETMFFMFAHPRLHRKKGEKHPRETKLSLTKISKSS